MKKFTVTVGICALNEEAKIGALLKSVLSQRGNNYILKEIIVISDGSSDHTVDKVQSVKDPRIILIDSPNRQGMNRRLNYIFSHATGDVILKLDADILPATDRLIELIVEPFRQNSDVGLVSGKLIPVKPNTFIEVAINSSRLVWDKIRDNLKNGESVYCMAGGVYALSKRFARIVTFPANVWSDVGYLYFRCVTKKFIFQSIKNATVWFQPPTNLADYIKQMHRYNGEQDLLVNIFPKSLIQREYSIPRHLLYKYKLQILIRDPIHTLSLFLINFYIKYLYFPRSKNRASTWSMISSTKKAAISAD